MARPRQGRVGGGRGVPPSSAVVTTVTTAEWGGTARGGRRQRGRPVLGGVGLRAAAAAAFERAAAEGRVRV